MEKERSSVHLLSHLQNIQDLLAEKAEICLVLTDAQGRELTIPSRLPPECQKSELDSQCQQTIHRIIKEADRVPYPVLNRCHRRLYLFSYKTGIGINGHQTFINGGRVAGLDTIKQSLDLVTAIFALPLAIGGQLPGQDPAAQVSLNSELPYKLTRQELKILYLVSTGCSNKDIAAKLFISANTVKVHLSRLMQKLHLTKRTDATLFALQHGLIKRQDILQD